MYIYIHIHIYIYIIWSIVINIIYCNVSLKNLMCLILSTPAATFRVSPLVAPGDKPTMGVEGSADFGSSWWVFP